MNREQTGYLHSVETFGTVDGPGMRYVLFLSGCTLGCIFCHNRDTWEFGNKTISVTEVLADYEKYRSFYDASGGGLTISGGEPLLQPDFVGALFQACREQGIHTTLDTAGFCAPNALEKVLPYTDLVMFSVKAANRATHLRLTGQERRDIIENLRLVALTTPLIVRHVIIPGITDTEQELAEFAELICSLPIQPRVELLPYHQAGRQKWQQLSLVYPLDGVASATADDITRAAKLLSARGVVGA
ncbi:pyruvate formate lyase-activating protein [Anaerosporomusa subterranea]|uniref:Pyruvate formate-lyase-activating enzyme n=1 Tax=Anaerosporomusa subterranea TaxID=1794912 RepID=A0A154BPC5_ANASB|nr:pyruvate formate-lyase-activating protein [Anaerosporomusa subterranea]KYZ75749.1 pyruvate formate lyase-activating protein [Anaerosporomusa subterranea]